MTPQYLLRIDDVCPTMRWDLWHQIEDILVGYDVKPIVAVIPDNKDPKLMLDRANGKFWDKVREWQKRGWTIGLHGYQHRYVTECPGIIGFNKYSEFAGLPFQEQKDKLKKAMAIFAAERVKPDLWVAPAHSFDLFTVEALFRLGIRTISDGLQFYPHRDGRGMFWIPQQLGQFRRMPFGVWTVCIHLHDVEHSCPDRFRKNIETFRKCIVSTEDIVAQYGHLQTGVLSLAAGRLLRHVKRTKLGLSRYAERAEVNQANGTRACMSRL